MPGWATLVRADNPSPMTLEGTNTYVLRAPGAAAAVVVDPGPLDETHLRAVAAVSPVELILLTHGHPDHAEGARLLQELTGAPMAAVERRLCVGAEPLTGRETFDVAGLGVRVVPSPGHTSDSVCFAIESTEVGEPGLLTGDTVLGRGTTVVAHPDGRLADYLESLRRLRDLAAVRDLVLLPGHGPAGGSVKGSATAYLAHREERLAQVRAALAAGARTPQEVVRTVYADVDPVLWPAAELSVRAQLDYLAEVSPRDG